MAKALAPTHSGHVAGWPGELTAWGRAHGAFTALVILVMLNALFTPHFASARNLWSVLLQVANTVLVSVGMALVIATGGIDLSVGSVMAVGSAVCALAMPHGPVMAGLAGLGAAAGIGLLNGLLVNRFRVQPFITTLATMIAGRGVAQVLCNEGELISFEEPRFEWLGRGFVGPVPVPVLLVTLIAVAVHLVIRSTMFGRYVLAVGGNEPAARLAGVPVGVTKTAVYAISGMLAGLAGLIETARLGATDPSNIGNGMEFFAIAAVVIGGMPFSGGKLSVGGAVTGALIMAVIAAGLNMLLVSFAWTLLIQAASILGAVYLQRPRVV